MYDFNYEGEKRLSNRSYNIIYGFSTFCGVAISALVAYMCKDSFATQTYLALIVGFICGLVGTIIASCADTIKKCIAGYVALSVSVGIMVSTIVNLYSLSSIYYALGLTCIIIFIMIIIACIFPNVFGRMSGTLCCALGAMIIVELIAYIGGQHDSAIYDYVVIGIFTLFVATDFQTAQESPKTAFYAVRNSVDIYLDFINLAIRLLGRSSSSSSNSNK